MKEHKNIPSNRKSIKFITDMTVNVFVQPYHFGRSYMFKILLKQVFTESCNVLPFHTKKFNYNAHQRDSNINYHTTHLIYTLGRFFQNTHFPLTTFYSCASYPRTSHHYFILFRNHRSFCNG